MQIFKHLNKDLPASLVVLFVAVPLCLGIALASGAPLISGIIAGVVGGIVVGMLSGSSLGVSGPAAGLAVIVLNAIDQLGAFDIFLLAVVIAGLLQLIMGYLKAGVIGYYFPSAVIKGMLAGIGIVISLKQIPHAVGYDADFEGDFSFFQPDGQTTFSELFNMLGYVNPVAIGLALTSLVIILFWERVLAKKHKFFTLLQGTIVVVLLGALFQYLAQTYWPHLALSAEHLVTVPVTDTLADFGKLITLPDFSQWANPQVYIVAVTLAIVASLETLLCVEATDKLDPHKRITPTNRELKAQGVGNMVSGLIGGLPVTQVIVRSSANIQAGAQTKLSAILHGVFLLILVLLAPEFLNLIPLSVLAVILILVGYKLAKPGIFRHMYSQGRDQFYPFIITILGIVFTDLLIGIGMGLVVALFIILLRNYRNSHFLHMQEKVNSHDRHKIRMELAEEVTFLNKAAIMKELKNLPPNSEVTIDMTKSHRVDYDVLEIIDNFAKTAHERDIEVKLIGRGDREVVDY